MMRLAKSLLTAWTLMAVACGNSGGSPSADTNTPPSTPGETRQAPGGRLELFGTFHAMGVVVTLPDNTDPNETMNANVAYGESDAGFLQQGFPLSRVAEDRFVGSLFDLDPGISYQVQVSFNAPGLPAWDQTILADNARTRSKIHIPTALQTLVAAPDGTGRDCSEGSPCDLATALDQAVAGTQIELRGGVYYQGELAPAASGTAGHPIVIRSYKGETAILDGSDPAVYEFTSLGNGLYSTILATSAPHMVLHGGERLFPYPSRSDLETLRFNVSGFYADGNTLYVHLSGDRAPDPGRMIISRMNHAFYVEQNYLYFIDLTFRYYGQGSYPKVFYLNNAGNNLIQGCTFGNNDLGVGIKRDSSNNLIQDCEFYDAIFDWPWDPIKDYGGLEDGGIRFFDPVDGRGNVIRRNIFHDDFDGFGVCPGSSAAVTNETDVYDNLIYNMGDDGMETDGQCSNVRIWNNTFHDVLMGISLAPVYTGPVYCLRNLVYRTGVGNNDYTGSPFKFNSGYGQSGPIYLFHNTADAVLGDDNNGLFIKAPGTWEMIQTRNNIWAGTSYAVNNYNLSQPVDLDYDNLWNGNRTYLVRWGSNYTDLAAFAADTGQEVNGYCLDPQFLDPANGNYTLASGSTLIDKGVIIPGINQQYNGDGPDPGAFER